VQESELILNVLRSNKPLSNILEHLKNKPLAGVTLQFHNIDEDVYYKDKHRRIYGVLQRHATSTSFTGFTERRVNKDMELNVISTDGSIINDIKNSTKDFKVEAKLLTQEKISELLSNKNSKYKLLESYARLALNNFCKNAKLFWFHPDFDLDPQDLHAYISVDTYGKLQSVSELIKSGKYSLEDLKNKRALVPYGNNYEWGQIIDFLDLKISEYTIDEGSTLYEYYKKNKNTELDPNEKPVVSVRLTKIQGKPILEYPPSQVRLSTKERPAPHERYHEIETILDKMTAFKLFDVSFEKYQIIKYNNIDIIHGIKLQYSNQSTTVSPIVAIQKYNATLLRGRIKIHNLHILLPRELRNGEQTIITLIKTSFKENNLGEIENIKTEYYENYSDDLAIKFSNKLDNITKTANPTTDFIMPIITENELTENEQLFDITKRDCSKNGFIAKPIKIETIRKILTGPKNLIDPTVFNILLSIYTDFNIQNSIFKHEIPSNIAWKLAKPADDTGETVYAGFDVSREAKEGASAGIIFILYDSYGSMLSANIIPTHGEKLSYNTLFNTLLELFKNLPNQTKRIVIFRDGPIRSPDEISNITKAFENLNKQYGIKHMDFIGVIKRHNLRLFKNTTTEITNPDTGFLNIWSINRFGVDAERALIISSEAKIGTTKPIIIERYKSPYNSNKSINDIAKEYLHLCRLNFWNGIIGASKLPLPLKMADTLAYLAMKNVPIRIP
jgi:hypothetical protein